LSKKLLQFRSIDNLLETLLHELIHAYLFLTKDKYERNDGVDGHGKDFVVKMLEINRVTGLKLSVYHTFHDEVDHSREHVWLCDGKCAKVPPHFGVVKRARNMPPGPQDWWFEKHKLTCGGSHVKIIEPRAKSTEESKQNGQ
jgi:SprT-like domain-contaning protein Spartan